MDRSQLIDELVKLAGFSREAALVGVRAGFACEYCGRSLLDSVDEYDVWESDHIAPVSRNGEGEPSSAEHLALACRLCNKIKRNWTPEGFAEMSREDRINAARIHIFAKRADKVRILLQVREILAGHRRERPPRPI